MKPILLLFSKTTDCQFCIQWPSKTDFTIVFIENDLYVAECPEVGTVSQGCTIEAAIANLKETAELYLKEFLLEKVSKPTMTTFETTINV